MNSPREIRGVTKAGPRDFPSTFVWLGWLVWLPFLIPPIIGLAQAHLRPLQLTAIVIGVTIFFAIYLWITWRAAFALRTPPASTSQTEASLQSALLPIVILTLLSFVIVRLGGPSWGGLFFYTSATTAARLPFVRALVAVAALTLLVVVGGWMNGIPVADLLQSLFLIPVIGFSSNGAMWAVKTNRELRVAREELARLAVSEERLRFARDLHDLLGHTLSLIALKSELAGRLVPLAPERAVSEIGDIETAARTALQEVREAVAGYRQPTLANEMRAAREILAAAGIELTQKGENFTATAPTEAALSWAVREGVTNVIRHSRARHCVITVSNLGECVSVEILDDGHGAKPVDEHESFAIGVGGSGLRGLTERVAALHGSCEIGPHESGGFRLAVTLPYIAETPARQTPQTAMAHQTRQESV